MGGGPRASAGADKMSGLELGAAGGDDGDWSRDQGKGGGKRSVEGGGKKGT